MSSRRLPIIAGLWLACTAVYAAPFPTRDENPLLGGLGLAICNAARLPGAGATRVDATLNWSNTASIQDTGNEFIVADAEARNWLLSLSHGVTSHIAVSLRMNYRTLGNGTLDGFIARWHSAFGMPQGVRPLMPNDALRIEYDRGPRLATGITQSHSQFGTVDLATAYQLSATPTHATSITLSSKVSLRDGRAYFDSGATDYALAVTHERTMSRRWSLFAQLDQTRLGKGVLLSSQQQTWVTGGTLGFDYRYSPALTLTLQVDGHTAVFKHTALNLLGNAWVLTVGGDYRLTPRWRLQFGLGEDIKVGASPDVNFLFHLMRFWQ